MQNLESPIPTTSWYQRLSRFIEGTVRTLLRRPDSPDSNKPATAVVDAGRTPAMTELADLNQDTTDDGYTCPHAFPSSSKDINFPIDATEKWVKQYASSALLAENISLTNPSRIIIHET